MTERLPHLVREGLPLLRHIARGIARRIGGEIEVEDLISLGHPALVEVARTYEPNRSKFSTFAALKVKWAILDGLRREERGRPAWVKARVAALSLAERYLDDSASVSAETAIPTSEEACKARLHSLLEGQAAALAIGLTIERDDTVERIPDSVESPEESALRAELRRDIRSAVSSLPPRERTIVERHYFAGVSFDEIAKDLGLSKSWTSRLHTSAISMLAETLRGIDD